MTRSCSPLSSKLPSTWRPIWPVGVVMTIMGNLQGMIVMRIAITRSLNASSLFLGMVYPGAAR
jgi:hypothetical protein